MTGRRCHHFADGIGLHCVARAQGCTIGRVQHPRPIGRINRHQQGPQQYLTLSGLRGFGLGLGLGLSLIEMRCGQCRLWQSCNVDLSVFHFCTLGATFHWRR